MFALIEDFQIFGTDIDPIKVQNTRKNIEWLAEELEEPIPPKMNQIIKTVDICNLSNEFQRGFFDGICTEPDLGPFYVKPPYYQEIKELIDIELEKRYEHVFREASQLLKPRARIAIIAPIFSTIDGGEMQINVEKLARGYDFKLIPMLSVDRIVNKSDFRLQFQKSQVKTFIDAKKDQIVKRKLYVFENAVHDD
jgi:tRNA G10  N-methylase Trm11